MFDKAILLIGFNRPEIIKKSFDAIKNIRPSRLYIAIDGPRKNHPYDNKLVHQVHQVVKNVSWDCEASFRFLKTNIGAERNISSSITWAFNREKDLIILEDDIVVDDVFFYFMKDMLDRYKCDHKLFMISGCNFTPNSFDHNFDYTYSKYGHTYGWATWKDRWQMFNLDINIANYSLSILNMKPKFNSYQETFYHIIKFERMKDKGPGNNSWDACLSFIMRYNELLSVVPRYNLSKNIGIKGLHSDGKITYHMRETNPNYRYNMKPNDIFCDKNYDLAHFKNHIKKIGTLKMLVLLILIKLSLR